MSGQACKRCGDFVEYLSTDGLCDGCVIEDGRPEEARIAEDAEPVTISQADLAGSLAAMRLARPGWSYEDTAADLMVVLQGGESCEPVTDQELDAEAQQLVDQTQFLWMQAQGDGHRGLLRSVALVAAHRDPRLLLPVGVSHRR